ncbi:HD-GYP domain-containing protein [Paenibacillus sp. YYML68]|uniref:HD-GYP domain-containing protein n=1 Tax=Paenibacillus sp. YYML68 TaxID=2909250 RepID=UPI002493C0BB|nr:HD-GYP domain-containing protein [Paenibacillus sp. YYML68]
MLPKHLAKTDRIRSLIVIGQISVYFGLLILALRHYFVFPAQHFELVAAIMLIGFLPSLVYRYAPESTRPYILMVNALGLVSFIFSFMQEWALAGVFILVPVFSLLFQNRVIYFVSVISSLLLHIMLAVLFMFDVGEPQEQLVIVLDVLTVFLISVFIIYFVVRDVLGRNRMETKHLQTILTLSQSVEAKDPYTQGHSRRVAQLAKLIALDVPALHPDVVYNCGLIHDVGKLSISDAILQKTSRLTHEEFEMMKSHTTSGARMCANLDVSKDLIDGVLHHHERYDGKGYPHGLKGEDIPLIARVLCVADSIDAMCSNRSYRTALGLDFVAQELARCKGEQFDPAIVQLVQRRWQQVVSFYEQEEKLHAAEERS